MGRTKESIRWQASEELPKDGNFGEVDKIRDCGVKRMRTKVEYSKASIIASIRRTGLVSEQNRPHERMKASFLPGIDRIESIVSSAETEVPDVLNRNSTETDVPNAVDGNSAKNGGNYDPEQPTSGKANQLMQDETDSTAHEGSVGSQKVMHWSDLRIRKVLKLSEGPVLPAGCILHSMGPLSLISNHPKNEEKPLHAPFQYLLTYPCIISTIPTQAIMLEVQAATSKAR